MKPIRLRLVILALAFSLAFGISPSVRAQFDDLVKHVPETANALFLVNAQKLFASPAAQKEGWAVSREARFAAGLSSVPPHASQLVIATQFDLEFMQPVWEVAVVRVDSTPDLAELAGKYGGAVDKVNTTPAVRLPDDSFVVQFPDQLLGAMSPGNRQQVFRWISRSNHAVSAYLQDALRFADSGTEVIMALDLKGALAADEVEYRLGGLDPEVFKNAKMDAAELAPVLASIEGIMLGITIRDTAYGKIKMDFGSDPAKLATIAKPLFLEILGHRGAMIDDFKNWQLEIKGNQVFLGGPLTYSGLTRIGSIVELPTHALHVQTQPQSAHGSADPQAAGQNSQPTVLESTQQYYKSVERLLENLKLKKSDMKTMGQLAMWFDNYGRKVDRLPILNVDEEMLQYGSYISGQLHQGSMALKGITIQRRVSGVQARNSVGVYGGIFSGNMSGFGGQSYANQYGGAMYGAYGRYRTTNAAYNLAARGGVGGAINSQLRQQQRATTEVQVQARAQAGSSVQQIVAQIQDATTTIRHNMTQKYQVEF